MSSAKKAEDQDEESGAKKGRVGRRRIPISFIHDKSRRQITFSKRKAGIMKKAYELSTLTGTQVLLLVASETGHVYTFATPKLQPLITKAEGKNLIQACLNAPEAGEDPEIAESLLASLDVGIRDQQQGELERLAASWSTSRNLPTTSSSSSTSSSTTMPYNGYAGLDEAHAAGGVEYGNMPNTYAMPQQQQFQLLSEFASANARGSNMQQPHPLQHHQIANQDLMYHQPAYAYPADGSMGKYAPQPAGRYANKSEESYSLEEFLQSIFAYLPPSNRSPAEQEKWRETIDAAIESSHFVFPCPDLAILFTQLAEANGYNLNDRSQKGQFFIQARMDAGVSLSLHVGGPDAEVIAAVYLSNNGSTIHQVYVFVRGKNHWLLQQFDSRFLGVCEVFFEIPALVNEAKFEWSQNPQFMRQIAETHKVIERLVSSKWQWLTSG